jgi:hypothetical protein
LLLLHISNRSLNLEPVARGLAEHLGWKTEYFVNEKNEPTGEDVARWVLITENDGVLERLAGKATGWSAPVRAPILWTDDFASLWHVL